jgi:hypothetical protein
VGNAVGPVALIAAGIYLGYLTITGRAANFAAFLASGGKSVTPTAATAGSVQSAVQSNLSTTPGTSMTGLPSVTGTASGLSAAQASSAALQVQYDPTAFGSP